MSMSQCPGFHWRTMYRLSKVNLSRRAQNSKIFLGEGASYQKAGAGLDFDSKTILLPAKRALFSTKGKALLNISFAYLWWEAQLNLSLARPMNDKGALKMGRGFTAHSHAARRLNGCFIMPIDDAAYAKRTEIGNVFK
ncbi:hypothetical protein CEXT_731831 [Caerostris extrusa]|uniref:Uncharacterized protein n=1 Tax=Caerostris extrusa TaxID=172846 RepID=A0AAV4NAR2_CAEEX|nr:hypothetical protein CEXT_731831 [Caerostris extrusa]